MQYRQTDAAASVNHNILENKALHDICGKLPDWIEACFVYLHEKAESEMKIAIPLFGTRVAPRLDMAQELMLIAVEDGVPAERQTMAIANWPPAGRPERLTDLGVRGVICGALCRRDATRLDELGITVYGFVTGEAEDALTCFLHNELKPAVMVGRGGRCQGRWRFRNRRHRPDAESA